MGIRRRPVRKRAPSFLGRALHSRPSTMLPGYQWMAIRANNDIDLLLITNESREFSGIVTASVRPLPDKRAEPRRY